jgi:disulfide oxidoreductase YuzD
MENKKHKGNYVGTTNMQAKNQDMAFVNDTLENAKNMTPVNIMKDDVNEGHEEEPLNTNGV